ncbi:hypothetical protein AYI69_g6467 [Smittium culicis]|uniref:Uncharacterized protein n=1 Tax=Smittium culicis TaxID=133412 RepID=A0A1R1XYM6_9FUNG|nr:hypothetical protein AYI69_g6467 [Smittium culicis]
MSLLASSRFFGRSCISSAKNNADGIFSQLSNSVTRSSTYKLNMKGDRIDPWKSPLCLMNGSDDEPLMLTVE